jgi:inner membrane protein
LRADPVPTIFTHAVVPLALGAGLGSQVISRRLMLAGMAAAILPDLDVIAFHFGIPYGSEYGHRGFSHSLAAAAILGLALAWAHRTLKTGCGRAFLFLFFAAASHGVLDAFTNGGSGIALLWPFSPERFFAPVTPIEVSPIGLSRFLTARGAAVFVSELLWVWLPCAMVAMAMIAVRRPRLT